MKPTFQKIQRIFFLIFFLLTGCEIKDNEKNQIDTKKSFQLISTSLDNSHTLQSGETLLLEFEKEPDPLLFSKNFLLEPFLAGNWFFEFKKVYFTPTISLTKVGSFTLRLTDKILSTEKEPLKEKVLFFKILPEKIPQTTLLSIGGNSFELKNQWEKIISLKKPPHRFEIFFTILPIESTFLQYLTATIPLQIDEVDIENKKIEFSIPQIESYQQEKSELALTLNAGWMGKNSVLSDQKWNFKIRWEEKEPIPFALKKIFILKNPEDPQAGFIEIQNNQFTQEWVDSYSQYRESYLLFLFKTPYGSEIDLFSMINSFNAVGENNSFQIQKDQWLNEEEMLKALPSEIFPKPSLYWGEENGSHYKWVGLKAKMLFPKNQYGMIRFSFSAPLYNTLDQVDKPKTILFIRYNQ